MEKYFKEAKKIIKAEAKRNKVKLKKSKIKEFLRYIFKRKNEKDKNASIVLYDELHNYKPKISEEEMYNLYKTAYMQNPLNLLTNENLSKLEEHCINNCRYNSGRIKEEHEIVLQLIDEYKKQVKEVEKMVATINKDSFTILKLGKMIDEMAKACYLTWTSKEYEFFGIEYNSNHQIAIKNITEYFRKRVGYEQ